tara:strand:- start:59 stop:511 length:453 start_codon:yes stop_codon:yes gene_type:complete
MKTFNQLKKNKKEDKVDTEAVAERLKNNLHLLKYPIQEDMDSILDKRPRHITAQEREYYKKAYDVYLKTEKDPRECLDWYYAQVSDLEYLFRQLHYNVGCHDEEWSEVVKTFLQTVPEEILYKPCNCQTRRMVDHTYNFEELYPKERLIL